LIAEGLVSVNSKIVDKNAHDVDEKDEVSISDLSILKFVSRAGLKLEYALEHVKLDVQNFSCLDVGQSTGGFTDCLLQRGAKFVTGIEVGHGQLHENLKHDPRIKPLEKIHIADFVKEPTEHFDLIVVDLSFISLTKVIKKLTSLMSQHTQLLALVKPQFEVGSAFLNKAGLVKDPELYPQIEQRIKEFLQADGLEIKDYFQAFPKGGDGNQEFFVYAAPTFR
jgi:23S rRNA (cytidine1920-2'-O)/16S rRNA (cytidine1409-2'-O)-methyltransferase